MKQAVQLPALMIWLGVNVEIDTHRKDACENCSYVATKPEPSGKVDSLEKLLLLRLQREHDSADILTLDL